MRTITFSKKLVMRKKQRRKEEDYEIKGYRFDGAGY